MQSIARNILGELFSGRLRNYVVALCFCSMLPGINLRSGHAAIVPKYF